MTKQQLRAMSRRHLLLMIGDLTQELEKASAERERMLLAYQWGLQQAAAWRQYEAQRQYQADWWQ